MRGAAGSRRARGAVKGKGVDGRRGERNRKTKA